MANSAVEFDSNISQSCPHGAGSPQSLIVFSHLRWNFVFQRPQHLLTRLAQHYSVYFFEEPVTGSSQQYLEITAPTAGVRVCRPHSRIQAPGFHDEQIPALQEMLLELIRREQIVDYAVWFYSPMALPLIQRLTPKVVVYDCMDELSSFRNAPRQLLQRESALLKAADVVFTGGPSLYRAKRDRHANVHCFPSSVDADHFGRGRDRANDHSAQRALPRPRAGYVGVIDERLDLSLVSKLGKVRPHWQICMVGPVAKIDPESLPRQPNIHYFGQQPYEDLPRFLAGWDVCLQPFALNEATRYISPTKTLEYMAAERPIVSTPITDVVEPYGDIVRIANGFEAFIAACDDALRESAVTQQVRLEATRAAIAKTSWDRTAAQMRALMESAASARQLASTALTLVRGATKQPAAERAPEESTVENMASKDYPVVIIGAGPTGLSAAYHLGKDSVVLERNATVGGWCRSIQDNGFTFDHAGHIMFSNDPYVHELYGELLRENVHWQDREAWIYSKGVHTRYPFQGALFGLPADVLKECIIGAIEARFGKLKEPSLPKYTAATASAGCAGKAASITDCCADGIAESTALLVTSPRGMNAPKNFEEFIYTVWGAGVAKHFAIPYNRKLWSVPLSEMETSWLGGRVPMPDLEEMIEGALRPTAKPMGPNARFGYPLRGGFQALMNGFLPLLKGDLRTNAKVSRVMPSARKVVLSDGSAYRYRQLISTAPLPKLIGMIGPEVPPHVLAAARQLRHVSVRCINLGVGRENLTDKHWIYYPEDTVFHRIFVQGNASPHCNAPGGFALTCEITYGPAKPLPCEGEALIDRCIEDCIAVGMIRPDDRILVRNQVDMSCAYVVYDHSRKQNVDIIRAWLLEHDILLAGRYSEWEYYNSDHAFIAGRKVAEAAAMALESHDAALELSEVEVSS